MGCAGTKGLSTGGDTKDKKPEKKEKPRERRGSHSSSSSGSVILCEWNEL